MSNLDNSLFESVCNLLGIDKKAVEEYLKDSMSNMTCDIVKETPAINRDDMPDRMNPEGKSVNQLKAEGWNLVENVEKAGDGTYICKRVWTKGAEPEKEPEEDSCNSCEEARHRERIRIDNITVDDWMNTLNWALLHNWGLMSDAMHSKFSKNPEEVDSVLRFLNFIFKDQDVESYSVDDLWNQFPSKNAYAIAEALDSIIKDIMDAIQSHQNTIVTGMSGLCPESRENLINRLIKYRGLLRKELDNVEESMDRLEPQYHHTKIVTPFIESSLYSAIYLWYSLITEYLAELIEITNKILSANKVL